MSHSLGALDEMGHLWPLLKEAGVAPTKSQFRDLWTERTFSLRQTC
jgi:hypothetical protein